jgi:hypothetical protein
LLAASTPARVTGKLVNFRFLTVVSIQLPAVIAGVFDGLNVVVAWREYRRLARLLHPDTGSDHDVFIELGVG